MALRWSGEQMEGARQALSAARSALQALKAVEKKRQQKVRPRIAALPVPRNRLQYPVR